MPVSIRALILVVVLLLLPWLAQAAPSQVLVRPGTPVIFADSAQTPTRVLSFAPGGVGLAAGTGRVSAQYDKGVGAQPSLWELRCHLSLTNTNILRADVQFMLVTSDGTDVDAGVGTADAAITVDQHNVLPLIGSLYVYQQTAGGNVVMFMSARNIYIPGRFFSLAVWNNTTLALQSSTTAHRCTMTPMTPESQ